MSNDYAHVPNDSRRRPHGPLLSRRVVLAVRVAAAVAAGLTLASPTAANGRFPATGMVVLNPMDSSMVLGRSTYGFLLSNDHGANWDWICEQSVGFSGPEDPMLAFLSQNAIVGTLATGVITSKDNGCSWQYAPSPVPPDLFVDLAARKNDPRVAFAISSTYAGGMTDAGQLLFRSELFMTSDGATTWTKIGEPFDPTLLLETIDVAESNVSRVYVSAIRGSGSDLQGYLLVSDDAGLHWQSRTVPLIIGDDRAPFIGAVSPTQADTIYVRTSATTGRPNRLLVSIDAGRSWQVKHQTTGAMLGFALSQDGSKVYLGSQEDGLWMANANDLTFAKKSRVQVQCLTAAADGLWACSNEVSGFVYGFSKDDGATFEAKLRLHTLRGPLACPSGTPTHDKCEPDWPRLRDELGVTVPGDAGADATPDAGALSAAPDASSCGCGVGGGPSAVTAGALSVLLARMLRRRSHRAKNART